jgi:PAS domain S-box-containing protein
MMLQKWRVLALIAIMSTVAIAAAAIAIAVLYDAAVEVERKRLAESAQSQARWIETMARFEIMNSVRDPQHAELVTLNQFFEAHSGYEVFAETGETVLARREGDQIVFLMRHGTGTLVADDRLPFDFKRAQPMHRALQGLSGTMIGIDHDGVRVLAAYEPVDVLDLGIVSKIDITEVRAPFVRAGLMVAGISFGLVVVGAWLLVAISQPMIRDLQEHSRHLERVVRALRDSEERFRHTFEQAAVGVAHIGLDGGFLRFNSRLCDVTGYAADELMGMRAHELSHPDDLEAVASDIASIISGGLGTLSSERRYLRKDGTAVWVDNTMSLVRDEQGQPCYLIAMVADATARKVGEAELAASQRELALHNAVAEVFLTVPDDQMYEKVLQPVMTFLESRAGIFAYIDDDGDLVVPSMRLTLPERSSDDRDPVVIPRESWGDAWGEALVHRRSVLANRAEPAQPGHPPTSRSIVVPIIDRDELIGLLEVANRERDYTEEHLREMEEIANHVGPILHARLVRDRLERERDAFNRALVTSENRYRAIVQQQTEFVARFLPDGTLTFVNEALCRYSGRDAFELIGQSLWRFMSDEMRSRSEAHLGSLSPDRPGGENEITWTVPDGTTRWLSFVNTALFDSQGRLIEYQSVGRDVTDRHDREVALERALAEKEILLKEIHHRVKNNMAVISSLLSLHERGIADPTAREVFQAMRGRIKTMSLVHEQLYRSGDFKHIDLGAYFGQVARMLVQSQDDASGRIKVVREISNVTLDLERAIPCGLILTELVSNALKHAFPEGREGTVRISLSERGAGEVELAVEDDGIGYDAAATSGFGLHMVGLLVQQINGTIDHDVDAGRRVVVRFPLRSP